MAAVPHAFDFRSSSPDVTPGIHGGSDFAKASDEGLLRTRPTSPAGTALGYPPPTTEKALRSPSAGRRKLLAILAAVGAAIVVLGIALGVGLGVGLGKHQHHAGSDGGSSPKRRLPPSPANATFLRFAPCPNVTKATVPMMHSSLWVDPEGTATSNATTAVVVQHGIGRNFQVAFSALAPVLDLSTTVLVSPNFYYPSDEPHVLHNGRYSNWFDRSQTLAWGKFASWVGGADPIAPNASVAGSSELVGQGKQCSTYDIHDRFFALFSNTSLYPHIERIIFAGHSGGGALMSRYALFAPDPPANSNITLRFVHANAPNFAYWTAERPNATETKRCPGWDDWNYGMQGSKTRYVAAKMTSSLRAMHRRYLARDIVALQGNMDARRWFPVGDYECEVQAQGGNDRRDRNYAWWVYKNLLAGSPTNVTQFPFYAELRRLLPGRMALENATLPAGAASNSTAGYTFSAATAAGDRRAHAHPFRHRFCVVPDVGHVAALMWNSSCGVQAFSRAGPAPDPASASLPPLQPEKYRGAKPRASDHPAHHHHNQTTVD